MSRSARRTATAQTPTCLLHEIRDICAEIGLKIVSVSSSLYAGKMGSPDAKDRAFAKALIRRQLECASLLGGRALCVLA